MIKKPGSPHSIQLDKRARLEGEFTLLKANKPGMVLRCRVIALSLGRGVDRR